MSRDFRSAPPRTCLQCGGPVDFLRSLHLSTDGALRQWTQLDFFRCGECQIELSQPTDSDAPSATPIVPQHCRQCGSSLAHEFGQFENRTPDLTPAMIYRCSKHPDERWRMILDSPYRWEPIT